MTSSAPLSKEIIDELRAHGPDDKRSLTQAALNFTLFFALLGLMAIFARDAYWLTLLLAAPTAGMLVRLFIIQHDCGHGAYFKSRTANNVLGSMISVLTLTPYDHWRHSHGRHHASSSNLDRRGQGDVVTKTVDEYRAMPPLERIGYRLYRNPIVMILIGAPLNFMVFQRLPLGRGFRDASSRRSIMTLNFVLLVVFGTAMAIFGVMPVLSVYLPMMIIAAWIGGWLFYVQHQFEGTYWARNGDWDFQKASLAGSSYFELPRVLQWFTGNIGLHHIHHLCCRIPNYRLQACFDAHPELRDNAMRISLRDSLKCWRLSLWDEERQRLISFSELKTLPAPA